MKAIRNISAGFVLLGLMFLTPALAGYDTVSTTPSDVAVGGAYAMFSLLFTVFMMAFSCFAVLFGIAFYAISIFFAIDALQRDFGKDETQKIIWVVLLFLSGYIGTVLYYFLIFKTNKYPKKK